MWECRVGHVTPLPFAHTHTRILTAEYNSCHCMAVTIKIAKKNHQRPLVTLSFCIRFSFGAPMDFNDRKSSLDLSCSGESSVEFVAECVDTTEGQTGKTAHRLSCILSDNEESLPKQRRRSRSISRLLTTRISSLVIVRLLPTIKFVSNCRSCCRRGSLELLFAWWIQKQPFHRGTLLVKAL